MTATYSFLNIQAAIAGPGGIVSLGYGAAVAEEGITVEAREPFNDMKVGADGQAMHSLRVDRSGKVMVRLLKTSPTNALLTAMSNFQRQSSANHGRNVITIVDTARGDVYTCQQVAFAKVPNNSYTKDAAMIEWEFESGQIDPLLGAGL